MIASRQRGFTLVEALVALLVLSIGLLGVAAMQLKSLQSAHAGYQRAAASLAAQDAVELLWAAYEDGQCHDLNGGDKTDWETRWKAVIPGLTPSVSDDGSDSCIFTVTLEWADSRLDGGEEQAFSYTTRLPGSGP